MASPKAKTIKLLLEDGTLNGVLTIEDTMWNTGEMYSAPREAIDDLLALDACEKYGIYMLLSENMVYVGQAGDLSKRIKQHLVGKDWWERVILLTTKDDSFTHTDIDYLESYFIGLAKKNHKLDCDNRQKGNKAKVSRFDKVQLDQYIDEAMFLLELIGVKVFCDDNEVVRPVIRAIKSVKKEQIEVRSKAEAIEFLNESGLELKSNQCTYAKMQDKKKIFWANPKKDFLQKDWDIILNDVEKQELIYIRIPAKTFKAVMEKQQEHFVIRKDKPAELDINIYRDTLIDMYSKIDLSRYVVKRYSYAK